MLSSAHRFPKEHCFFWRLLGFVLLSLAYEQHVGECYGQLPLFHRRPNIRYNCVQYSPFSVANSSSGSQAIRNTTFYGTHRLALRTVLILSFHPRLGLCRVGPLKLCAFLFFFIRAPIPTSIHLNLFDHPNNIYFIVFFLLGESPAPEIWVPTFRHTLPVPSS